MTPRQAEEGILELGLPDGGRILLSFEDDISGNADLENGVVLAMLAGGDSEGDVCEAVADHAEAMGLRAVVSDACQPVTVVIRTSIAEVS